MQLPSLPAASGARRLTPEPLNVAPALIGAPLGTPGRRALAMAVDLATIALVSALGGLWLAGGLLLVALQLRHGERTRRRVVVGWVLVAPLALLAAQSVYTRHAATGVVGFEADDGDDEDEAAAARQPAKTGAANRARDAEPAPAAIGAGLPAEARVPLLEAALAAARRPPDVSTQLRRTLRRAGLSFGWGIVYFALLPALWNGQTLGKKLLRLRVVDIAGRPPTVLRCLRRYGGYAAGMATGGLGFVQLLWDANRQGIQDRAAHTVVIDLRPEAASP